jgi:hypothetical protein
MAYRVINLMLESLLFSKYYLKRAEKLTKAGLSQLLLQDI